MIQQFLELIITRRLQLGLSQRLLSERIGVPCDLIERIEQGQVAFPVRKALDYAEALEIHDPAAQGQFVWAVLCIYHPEIAIDLKEEDQHLT